MGLLVGLYFFHFTDLLGTLKTTSSLGHKGIDKREGFLKLYFGHWFVLVCCYIIIHKRLTHLASIGASPLYVYMYVAMNNMLVYRTALQKKKKGYKNLFLKLRKSSNQLEFSRYTPSSPASCPMSTHPSIDSSIYPSTHSSFHPTSAILKLNPKLDEISSVAGSGIATVIGKKI